MVRFVALLLCSTVVSGFGPFGGDRGSDRGSDSSEDPSERSFVERLKTHSSTATVDSGKVQQSINTIEKETWDDDKKGREGLPWEKPIDPSLFPKASKLSVDHLCAAYYTSLNYKSLAPDNVIIGKCKGKTVVSFTGTTTIWNILTDLATLVSPWKLPYATVPNWRVLRFDKEFEDFEGTYLEKDRSFHQGDVLGGDNFQYAGTGSFFVVKRKLEDGEWSHDWADTGSFVRASSLKMDNECNVIYYTDDGTVFKTFNTFDNLRDANYVNTKYCRLKVSQQNGALYVASKDRNGITIRSPIIAPGQLDKELSYLDEIEEGQKRYGDICTGHSLGAALAKMHGHYGNCKEIVTLASPRVEARASKKTKFVRDYIRWTSDEESKKCQGMFKRDLVTVLPFRMKPVTANPIFLNPDNTDCRTGIEMTPKRAIDTHSCKGYINDIIKLIELLKKNRGNEDRVVHYKNLYHSCDKACHKKSGHCKFCGTHGVCCKKGDEFCGIEQGYENERSCQLVPAYSLVCDENHKCREKKH